jgi:hypothetical protein
LIGSAFPILVHSLLQSFVTGSPLPVELYPEALAYEGSYWATQVGQYRETIPRSLFLVELLLGPQGWLTVTPVLVFAPMGLAITIAARKDGLRSGAVVVAVVTLLLLAYSFGVRHLLPITPLVFFFAAAGLERLRHIVWSLAFIALMLFGAVYSIPGMQDPWSRIERRDDLPLRLAQRFVLYPKSSYNR